MSRSVGRTALEFQRTGNRSRYKAIYRRRRGALSSLLLAECLENRGRFLEAICDHVWAVCEKTIWVIPAHDAGAHAQGHGLLLPDDFTVDLSFRDTGMLLSSSRHLLGERLHPACRGRIEHEIRRRILYPYLRKEFGWRKGRNGWNAVYHATVPRSAVFMECHPGTLAEIVTRALANLQYYLESFDADGGTPEGIGYWTYGFSH